MKTTYKHTISYFCKIFQTLTEVHMCISQNKLYSPLKISAVVLTWTFVLNRYSNEKSEARISTVPIEEKSTTSEVHVKLILIYCTPSF